MTPEVAIDIVREAVFLIVTMAVIIITPSLLVGLLVSTFQAATQINEQTLSFLPRLIITLLMVVAAGPWMMTQLLDFSERLIRSIPNLIG